MRHECWKLGYPRHLFDGSRFKLRKPLVTGTRHYGTRIDDSKLSTPVQHSLTHELRGALCSFLLRLHFYSQIGSIGGLGDRVCRGRVSVMGVVGTMYDRMHES
jgi:hypothetical protein